MKTVIVYSSATGNTARLAQELSAQLNLPAMPLAEAATIFIAIYLYRTHGDPATCSGI